MSNQHELENLVAENERSLQTLVRAITLSQGEFSLILVRCNYAALRQDIVQRLHQLSPVQIREITLPMSVKTLYTSIGKELGDEQPPALMVFGLESVKDIDTVLTSANQVREEFRKNFPFPVLLLINDQVLQKLIRLATDFENWATIIHFAIATADLVQLINQTAESIFAQVLDAGAGKFLDNSALNLAIGSPQRVELELAQAELQKRGVKLDTELEASLEFVLGRDAVSMEQSRQHYERSLALWQQSSKLEQQGCVLHNLGLWWRTYAVQHLTKQQPACLQAKNYFHQCLEVFEQANRPDLVAKFINALGEVLQKLQQWDELEKVAQKGLELYQIYPDWFREARVYGFLAEVALAKSAWNKAKQTAEKALSIVDINQFTEPNANLELVRYYHQGWYLFSLARAQHQLNKVKDALVNLETARRETKPQYDPELYILILKRLRDIYYQQYQYFDAFQIKQEQIKVEHQYGFRAFIGAAYLNPQHEVINPALVQVEKSVKVAQEIAVSGRQKDVNRLLKRMSRNDHKLTVFHGHSGVGKSSILIGGLLPALQLQSIDARDVLPIVVRVYTDWIGVLTKCLTDNITSSNSIELICENLQINAERNLLTVLIFDQLEEFFVYTDKSKRQPFYEFLHLCLDIPFVKVILCLREDYLYYLLECDRLFNFTAINNNILDKHIRYELKNLSSEDAKAVVQSLTKQTNFYLEPTLIDKLVEDLSDEGEVRPIELQIVGAQLQTHKITTLEKYLQSGTKEKLVEGFLEEVIKDCGSENEHCARVVLYLLTDENRTRPLKTSDNLAEDLKTADIVSQEEKLNLVLEILVGSGLVLNIPEDPANRYQLVHDYLVSFIRQSQQARELEERKKDKEQRQLAEAELNRVLKQQRNWALIGGTVMTILAVLSVGFWGQAESQKREVENNRIIAISKTSEALFASGQRFDALKQGIKAGILLKQVPFIKNDEKKNIDTQVKAALQQPVYWLVERNRLEGHEGLIWGMSLSPDGEMIASASFDHTVKLWKRDGTLIKTLEGHEDKVLSVNFSPDSQMIASGDFDGTVILWKRDGTLLKKFKAHDSKDSNGVYGLSFSPDRDVQIFATASRDKTVKLWNTDGTLIRTFTGYKDGVTSVAFSPDGKTIATGSRDRTVKLWTPNGKLLKTFKDTHKDFVWAVAWSPDGKTIVTAGRDNFVKLWNLNGTLLKVFEGHRERVMNVSFSPDGKIIASASQDKTVKLWKLDAKSDGKLDGTLLTTLSGHTNGVYAARFSPDCKTLVTASADTTIKLWQLDAGSFLGKGNRPASTCVDSTIKGGQLGSGVLSTLNSHSDRVNKVSFSPDGQIIASASYDKTVKLWKPADGTLFKTLKGHSDQVNSVTFSPDGKIIASGSADKTVKLWKRDGSFIKTLSDSSDKILDVSFSPDGEFLAAGSVDNTVKVWQRDGNGEFEILPYQTLKGHRDWVRGVAWSPDANLIASASDDNTIKLWKRNGKEFKIYKTLTGENGHKSWVYSVSFSHDGKMIATTSNDKTAIIWKQDSDGEFRFYKKFKGHNDEVKSVTFSSDDQIIATASDDKTVKLWKLDGTLIRTLTGHSTEILSVSFAPDDNTLALGSADNTVILWHLQQLKSLDNLDQLLVHGCNWLHDYLKNNPNVSKSDRHLCDDIK
ncbi:MAG: tetratricopeptide repeat protein [Nostoc sp.]|uniref:WD40 domain-containing protein n=1 Tax=Nostoc sp. TaxID=1180 RepID=UPI002FFB4A41